MDYHTIHARDSQVIANTYARFPIALVRGQNARCWDESGKAYIDLTSGIGVNSLGYADAEWAEAVSGQVRTLQHACNLVHTLPCIEVAEMLCARTGMRKVFFANSGAESNEAAIKCSRKYGQARRGPACHKIVTLRQSFHGRTVTTLAATGQDAFHHQFSPLTQGFAYAQPGDIPGTLAMLDADTCAMMLEMVQGEGGVMPLDAAYVRAVAEACAERDIMLVVDEIQTGIGRTGALFAYEHYGVTPDIITCAKGLGGGLPIGAALFGEKCADVLGPGDHGTTFGGNPAACAGAKVVLSRLTGAFLQEVSQKGAYATERLLAMPGVTAVDGLGLMLGASLEGIPARDLVLRAISRGAIALTAKDRLRLLPPLTIPWDDLKEALTIIEDTLKEAIL